MNCIVLSLNAAVLCNTTPHHTTPHNTDSGIGHGMAWHGMEWDGGEGGGGHLVPYVPRTTGYAQHGEREGEGGVEAWSSGGQLSRWHARGNATAVNATAVMQCCIPVTASAARKARLLQNATAKYI